MSFLKSFYTTILVKPIFGLFLFLLSFQLVKSQPQFETGKYNYTIITNKDKSFGYTIYRGKKTFITQTTIPAIQGNKGFATNSDAEKCAKLVVKKLAQNNGLPSISLQELHSLKIKI